MLLKQIHCANLQAATSATLFATEICMLQTLKIDMFYFGFLSLSIFHCNGYLSCLSSQSLHSPLSYVLLPK